MVDGSVRLDGLDEAAQDGRLWKSYKADLSFRIADAVRASSDVASEDELSAALRDLRHVHHVLYVADRIRSAAVRERVAPPNDLLSSAELILERGAARQRRSAAHTQYATSARVNWHKLLKRLEVKTPRVPTAARKLRGLAGRDFNSAEVSILVQQHLEKTLAELRSFVEEAGRAYPEERPLLFKKWHRALEQARSPPRK